MLYPSHWALKETPSSHGRWLLVTLEQIRRNWVRSMGLSLGCLIKSYLHYCGHTAVNSRIKGHRKEPSPAGSLQLFSLSLSRPCLCSRSHCPQFLAEQPPSLLPSADALSSPSSNPSLTKSPSPRMSALLSSYTPLQIPSSEPRPTLCSDTWLRRHGGSRGPRFG